MEQMQEEGSVYIERQKMTAVDGSLGVISDSGGVTGVRISGGFEI